MKGAVCPPGSWGAIIVGRFLNEPLMVVRNIMECWQNAFACLELIIHFVASSYLLLTINVDGSEVKQFIGDHNWRSCLPRPLTEVTHVDALGPSHSSRRAFVRSINYSHPFIVMIYCELVTMWCNDCGYNNDNIPSFLWDIVLMKIYSSPKFILNIFDKLSTRTRSFEVHLDLLHHSVQWEL